MRLSAMVGQTLREVPAGADLVSHRLLSRSGMIRCVPGEDWAFLPRGLRSLQKLKGMIHGGLLELDGQELFGAAPRMITDWMMDMVRLVSRDLRSYRRFPCIVFGIQPVIYGEGKSGDGLLGTGWPVMALTASLHRDTDCRDIFFSHLKKQWRRLFERCSLAAQEVGSLPAASVGSAGCAFVVYHDAGRDEVVTCSSCGYAAMADSACCVAACQGDIEPQRTVEDIATPGAETIDDLAGFLGVMKSQTLKAVLYTATGGLQDGDYFLFVSIRGDRDVDERKLTRITNGARLRPATEAEIRSAGALPGYASPIGLRNVTVVADLSVRWGSNFVVGANREGYHVRNVNYGRDFEADIMADISLVRPGDVCPVCGQPVELAPAFEIARLNVKDTLEYRGGSMSFLDEDGREKLAAAGSFSLNCSRLLAAVVEQNHDEHGIIWPQAVAPHQISLITIGANKVRVKDEGERLYSFLRGMGYDVLYDDRSESAGVKFKDADLIGAPLRLVISKRTIADEVVEVKARDGEEVVVVPLSNLADEVRKHLLEGGR